MIYQGMLLQRKFLLCRFGNLFQPVYLSLLGMVDMTSRNDPVKQTASFISRKTVNLSFPSVSHIGSGGMAPLILKLVIRQMTAEPHAPAALPYR